MRCSNCGYIIPQGEVYCKRCGEEIRIVPDYNPLDDMLTAQIKISIENTDNMGVGNTRNRTTEKMSSRTPASRTQHKLTPAEREARRRRAEKKRELKRKKRQRLLLIMSLILVLFVAIVIVLYQNSYTGIVKKGNKALLSLEYANAQDCFEKAIAKKPEQADAYVGLSKIYISKSEITKAEKLFLDAIEAYSQNTKLYDACIEFYLQTNQAMKIPLLLSDADKNVQKDLSHYVVSKPEYSLKTGIVYDDVQQLTLTSSEEIIYYTVDGTEPTFNSNKYSKPIQLDEGETVIKAIAVNDKGVPGLPESKTYVIQLPIEDAPAVSPSTGQYEEAKKIEIKVPDGYTAYYTMDGSTPTTASSKYTGPIDMPENDTLFKAILVNAAGRSSGITTRNYILDIQESEE